MQGDYSVEFKRGYIHIRHGEGFKISPATMDRFWASLAELCEEHDCSRVLAEGPAPTRELDTAGAFESGVQAARIEDLWLAICFYGYEPDELSELFERAARNRGIHVKFFADRARALQWLGVSEDGSEADFDRGTP